MLDKKMKYVVFTDGVILFPVIFSRLMQHRDVANGLGMTPRSAGRFILTSPVVLFGNLIDDGAVETSGESISLGLHPQDAELIRRHLSGSGD